MAPVLVAFLPLPQVLPLVWVIHWFGDIWKMLLFRSGVQWAIGGLLVLQSPENILARVHGAFLTAYVVFIFIKPRFKIPQTTLTVLAGGALHGLSAGIFSVGGAVRGAFLTAYDLPKAVYIFTSGAIGLAVDSGRIVTYWSQGARWRWCSVQEDVLPAQQDVKSRFRQRPEGTYLMPLPIRRRRRKPESASIEATAAMMRMIIRLAWPNS